MSALVMSMIVGTLVSAGSQPAVIWVMRRWHVLDVPNARSSHVAPTPRGGGLGVGFGMLAAGVTYVVLSDVPLNAWPAPAITMTAIAMMAVGLLDDLHGLPPAPRFTSQCIAGGVVLASLGTPVWAWFAGALLFAGLVNAVNFMDGINGISAVTGILSGAWYAWLGASADNRLLMGLGVALVAGCLGFLPFNVPHARLFLGDSGSYLLGSTIAACVAISLTSGQALVVALAPMALYLADTSTTLLRRAIRRQPLTVAHRDHAYQRLVGAGMSHLAVAILAGVVTAAVCLAVAFVDAPSATAVLVLLAVSLFLTSPVVIRGRAVV